MKFIEILNHHNDNIYAGGWENITPVVWSGANRNGIILNKNGKDVTITVNDLLSPESGFLQAVQRKDVDDIYGDGVRAYIVTNREPLYKYHAIKLSILSQEDKIKYLEDNVIV